MLGRFLADTNVYFAMEGQDHRRRRALLTPFFSRDDVETMFGRIEDQARALLVPVFDRERKAVTAGDRKRGQMDFISEFTAAYSINIMAEILGLDVADNKRMTGWLQAWIAAEGNISGDPSLYEQAEIAKHDFTDYIRPIIEDRHGSTADDLISVLCRSEIDGEPMSDEEIQSLAGVMIQGGGETTGHQLEWLMHELIQHPDAQRELAADRTLMDKVLAEGMRYSSVVQYSARNVTSPVEIGGVHIEAGAPLAMMLASGNRDPRRWKNADTFDIHRDDHNERKAFAGAAEHLGFGGGSHFCLGSHVSKAEMQIALNVFLDNAQNITFEDGFVPQPNPGSPFVRTLPSLRVSFDLR
jgi:pulcherriminic acid synthase